MKLRPGQHLNAEILIPSQGSDDSEKASIPWSSPRRGRCALVLAIGLLFLAFNWVGSLSAQQLPVKMQVLVIAAAETDPSYVGITAFLDFVGVPFTSLIASKQTLTPAMLSDVSGGKFQGIILATDSLSYNGVSAFDTTEWQTLWAYEAAYKIRQVTYFTYPNSNYGLNVPSSAVSTTDIAPLYVKLTAAGQKLFPYLKASARIPVRFSYAYLAKVADAATTASLVEDDQGNAILSTHTYADGRENLAVTCDNWRYLLHSQLLAYGIIDWVTRGVHVGERTVYLTPQVDDIFLENELYDPQLKAGNPNLLYRLAEKDMLALESWQNSVRGLRDPNFQEFTLTMVFNGAGASGSTDDLVRYFSARQDLFNWINHTYNHLDLNTATYASALEDISVNDQFAQIFPMLRFRKESLVTGAISGLTNPEAMRALDDFGIKYIVSDTSRPEQNNPRPNIGIYNALENGVLQIPRHPTNVFTTASTSAQETGHYNVLYSTYWGKNLTYQEILDKESEQILSYMASHDIDPLMFHQSNLRAYDGKRSVLGDLMDATIRKYSSFMNLPVLSPQQHELGERMAQRMAREKAGVVVDLVPGTGIRITAKSEAVVPISGIAVGNLADIDTYSAGTYRDYGGKPTSWVKLAAGQTLTLPLTGGATGTLPPDPPPPAVQSATYFPTAVNVTGGSYDWGTLTSFKAQDNDTYDVLAAKNGSPWITDWSASAKMSGNPSWATKLSVNYKGYYSAAGVSQDLYLYNFLTASWEKMDTRQVGNSDDVAVSILVDTNLSRYISGTGEMRTRVAGSRTAGSFYCYANYLSWSVVIKTGGGAGNTSPVARDDSFTTAKNKPLNFTGAALLANDSDLDGNKLLVTAIDATGAKGGTVVGSAGAYTYTPPADFSGTDTFRYTVSDGNGGTASATISVVVLSSAALTPATYYPSSVAVSTGVFDWGTMASFTASDSDTYDVQSGTSAGNQVAEWAAVTKMTGSPAAVTKVTATYRGQYSVVGVTQEVSMFNYRTGKWDLLDGRVINQTDDVEVVLTAEANAQDYVSPAGELNVRVRGSLAGSQQFFCWANSLSWNIS